MVRKLDDRLDAIRAACERFHVVRLDVFGSALRDGFEPGRSDVDLVMVGALKNRYIREGVDRTKRVLYAA